MLSASLNKTFLSLSFLSIIINYISHNTWRECVEHVIKYIPFISAWFPWRRDVFCDTAEPCGLRRPVSWPRGQSEGLPHSSTSAQSLWQRTYNGRNNARSKQTYVNKTNAIWLDTAREEGNVLLNDALDTFYLRLYGRKEGNVLLNDTLDTFYLRLYWCQTVKDHSDSEREETCCRHMGYSFRLAARVLLYHPTDRIIYTAAFVTPVVEHRLEWEIVPVTRALVCASLSVGCCI